MPAEPSIMIVAMKEPVISSSPRRERGLIVVAALLALIQASAAWRALHVHDALAAQVSLLPGLEAAAGAGWALAAAWVTVMLLRRRPRARWYATGLLAGFALYSLGRLAVFAQADYDRQRLPFLAVATVAVLAVLVAYVARSAQVETTEKELNGRKSQD